MNHIHKETLVSRLFDNKQLKTRYEHCKRQIKVEQYFYWMQVLNTPASMKTVWNLHSGEVYSCTVDNWLEVEWAEPQF